MTEAVQTAETDVVDTDAIIDAPAADDTPDPFQDFARERGWAPKEEWRGKPEDWREPKDFIAYGMERGREANREMRELRTSVDRIGKTAEVLQSRAVEEARREAEMRFAGAVENKDHDAARAARDDLARIDTRTPESPAPDVNDFMTRNAAWFGSDDAATALAQATTARLAAQNVPVAEQLRQAEERVKTRFPELFEQPKPSQAQARTVNAPDTRAAQPTTRAKGFNDLPPAARTAGHDFVKRGMVKTLDDYARVYYEENA